MPDQCWADAIAPHIDQDIAELEWHQIAAFPLLVKEIKNVPSPTFTAKCCHFLAPRIFPVVDNDAVGSPSVTYEAYFKMSREEWLRTDPAIQAGLIASLTNEVQKLGRPLFRGYPMKCKVIELYFIGRHQGK